MLRQLSAALLLLSACAYRPEVASTPPSKTAPIQSEATHYTSLEFKKGKTNLSEISKKHLNELAAWANREGREIENIKILAWADREYPDKVQSKAPTREVILARERAESIKDYLQEDLHANEKIDSFNMAKRPGLLSKMVRGEEYAVKEKFEQTGATATKLDNGSMSYSKASRALVIIDYMDNK